MLKMEIKTLLHQLVQQELKKNTEGGKALACQFDIGISSYDDGAQFHSRRGLHVVYYVPVGYSYITVFSAVTNSPFVKLKDVKDWNHEVTHDSEWRNPSCFSNLYFKMACEVNDAREAKGYNPVAPVAMTEHNTFGFSTDNLYTWVDVTVNKDPKDKMGYRRSLIIH